MTTRKTRRAVLAGVAAVSAFSTGAPAVASLASDPAFAAIEAHRKAYAEFSEFVELTDSEPYDQWERFSGAEDKARGAFVKTVPTTLAGMLAMITYARDYGMRDQFLEEEVETLLASWATAIDRMPGSRGLGVTT